MGIRESLLNTITSVADSDFVRVVTAAGASSKATVANLFKSFESNLGAKSSLTTSDYIRVVGSDNVSYKQSVSNVKGAMGVTTLENRFKYIASGSFNDLQTYGLYLCQSLTNAPSTTWTQYELLVFGSPTTTKQVAFPTTPDGYWYIRNYTSSRGSWSAWTQMPTRAEVDALNNKTLVTNTSGAKNINLTTSYRGIMTIVDTSPSVVGMYIIYTTGSGNAGYKAILEVSGATLTGGANVLTYTPPSGRTSTIFIQNITGTASV